MNQQMRVAVCAVAFAMVGVPALAQQAPETRPATTTASGDTGLWFVPTA